MRVCVVVVIDTVDTDNDGYVGSFGIAGKMDNNKNNKMISPPQQYLAKCFYRHNGLCSCFVRHRYKIVPLSLDQLDVDCREDESTKAKTSTYTDVLLDFACIWWYLVRIIDPTITTVHTFRRFSFNNRIGLLLYSNDLLKVIHPAAMYAQLCS